MDKWAEYEKVVERIYLELQPKAKITRNDKIRGRQIDVSIRTNVASHDILVIVQAKDYSKPAGIKDVDQFESVIKEVRAQKGILICNAGFTKPAKKKARNICIDLCSIHDAQLACPHKGYHFLC